MTDYKGMAVTRDGDAYRVRRESREALVQTVVDLGPRRDPQLATTLSFFDHMLEMLGWYGDFVIDASYEVKTFRLMHVVMEDIGLALGAASAAAIRDRIADGVESSGFAHGVMDEASSCRDSSRSRTTPFESAAAHPRRPVDGEQFIYLPFTYPHGRDDPLCRNRPNLPW